MLRKSGTVRRRRLPCSPHGCLYQRVDIGLMALPEGVPFGDVIGHRRGVVLCLPSSRLLFSFGTRVAMIVSHPPRSLDCGSCFESSSQTSPTSYSWQPFQRDAVIFSVIAFNGLREGRAPKQLRISAALKGGTRESGSRPSGVHKDSSYTTASPYRRMPRSFLAQLAGLPPPSPACPRGPG
ncbi:hypothetical protein AAFF_G00273700 [Aldrovandia affinis]|uniref:Uncharacterized protein n=1 Tax=Aldrovandia affinis TaxID=143900 RepID=A0AAD7SRX3_9TELE|nr:hypothetical protein AAFF_G00273700 [Aldrovandia affinis]